MLTKRRIKRHTKWLTKKRAELFLLTSLIPMPLKADPVLYVETLQEGGLPILGLTPKGTKTNLAEFFFRPYESLDLQWTYTINSIILRFMHANNEQKFGSNSDALNEHNLKILFQLAPTLNTLLLTNKKAQTVQLVVRDKGKLKKIFTGPKSFPQLAAREQWLSEQLGYNASIHSISDSKRELLVQLCCSKQDPSGLLVWFFMDSSKLPHIPAEQNILALGKISGKVQQADGTFYTTQLIFSSQALDSSFIGHKGWIER